MGDLSLGEALALTNDGNGRNSNGFGDGNGWWIILLFLFLFWGGAWGRGGSGGGGVDGASLQGLATRADINEGFALNGLQVGISGLRDGQFGIQNALCQGFNGTNQAITALGYQMQDCCCQTQRAIDGVNYNMAKNTCDITGAIKDVNYNMATGFNNVIQNTHNDTDRIVAKLNEMETNRMQEKIQTLQGEVQSLRFQASQNAQNGFIDAVGNNIVSRLQQPSPIPAYQVPPPYPYCGTSNGCCA